MRPTTTLLLFLTAAIAFPGSLQAAGSPWTQNRGEGFFQLAYYTIGSYDILFQSSGLDFRLGREVTETTVEAYLEYGVTDNWTLIAVLPYRLPETGDLVANPTISPPTIASGSFNRPGNLRLGARRKFIDRGFLLSAQFDVELPTGDFDPTTGLNTGYDAFTFAPIVGAGKGWSRAYVYGYLGLDLRSDDFSSSWRTGFEGGYQFFGRLWLVGLLEVVESFEDGDVVLPQANLETGLYVNDQEYLAYGIKVMVDITRRVGVQLVYYSASSGNNVPRSPLLGFGVFYKW